MSTNDEAGNGYRFLQRVRTYSVVSGTFERARSAYDLVKNSHAIVTQACTLAEHTMHKALKTVGMPILERYDEQLKQLDSACTTRLNAIEKVAESACHALRKRCSHMQLVRGTISEMHSGLLKQLDAGREQFVSDYSAESANVIVPLRVARACRKVALRFCDDALQHAEDLLRSALEISIVRAIQKPVNLLMHALLRFDPLQFLTIGIDMREFQMDFDDDLDEDALVALGNAEWLMNDAALMHTHRPGNFQRTHAGRNHVLQRQRFRLVGSSRIITVNVS